MADNRTPLEKKLDRNFRLIMSGMIGCLLLSLAEVIWFSWFIFVYDC